MEGRQLSLLLVSAGPEAGHEQERFYAVVEPVGGSAGRVRSITAYPVGERYWNAARRKGPRLYPAPEPPKVKKKRKK